MDDDDTSHSQPPHPAHSRITTDARKSIGRRVSFAAMAHVRLYEKDAKNAPAPFSPIAGLNLSADPDAKPSVFASVDGDVQMPDLSSVRKNSDAFNIRLSLDNKNVIVDESAEDMSLDEDSSVIHPSHETSFDVTIKDAPNPYEHDRRDSVFSFFGKNSEDEDEEENMENKSPLRNALVKEKQAVPLPDSPARNLRRRDSVSAHTSSDYQNSEKQTNETRGLLESRRDSVAVFFGDKEDESMDQDQEMSAEPESMDMSIEATTPTAKTASKEQKFRQRDSIAPFFGTPVDDQEQDSPVSLVLKDGKQIASTTSKQKNLRSRDSIAPFFKEQIDEEDDESSLTSHVTEVKSPRRVVPAQKTDGGAKEFPPTHSPLPKSKVRPRDSIAPFFGKRNDALDDNENDEESDGVYAPPSQVESFDVPMVARSTSTANYRARDSIAPFFKDKDDDFSDVSMELAEDSSFLGGQELQMGGSSLVQDSDADESFSSEALDMDITNFTMLKPTLPAKKEASTPPSQPPAPTSRVLRSSSPKRTPPPKQSSSRRSSAKKTPTMSVSKSFKPAVSSPLARAQPITQPISVSSTPDAVTVSSAPPMTANITTPSLRERTPRASTTAQGSIAKKTATPKSILKTNVVQTPKLMTFLKNMKSEGKTPTTGVTIKKDESEEDTEMLGVDDTFNKPSEVFSRALSGRIRRGSSFGGSVKLEQTVILPTGGVDSLLEEKMPEPPKMSLDDFLQATEIGFIELSTTMRRETSAFNASYGSGPITELDYSKAACLYLPELKYLEFACKSLTEYVEEGRDSMKECEDNVDKSMPPLFDVFIKADEEEKDIMIGQLRALKSIARSNTKESWYRWREDMLRPFHNNILHNTESLKKDLKKIQDVRKALTTVTTVATTEVEALEERRNVLAEKYREYTSCDRVEYAVADDDFHLLSAAMVELPAAIQGKEEVYQKGSSETSVLEAKKAKLVESVQALNEEYEKLCDMMPDDVVGIQENYHLLLSIGSWKVVKGDYDSGNRSHVALEFGGGILNVTLGAKNASVSGSDVKTNESSLLNAGMNIFSNVSCNIARLPALMDHISHNHARLKIILGDLDDASRECDISVELKGNDVLVATTFLFNRETRTRFSVAFEFDLREVVYPNGRMQCKVNKYYGKISEDKIHLVVRNTSRGYGRMRRICKELRMLVE